jgi:hypothetical protein
MALASAFFPGFGLIMCACSGIFIASHLTSFSSCPENIGAVPVVVPELKFTGI